MRKQLATNLCGQRIKIITPDSQDDPRLGRIEHKHAGKIATIRTVSYDKDGDLRYSIEVDGRIYECYAHAFILETS